jgi:hypothetical protein
MGFVNLKNAPKKTNGADNVNVSSPNSTFGEVLVANLEPIAQGDFVHNINPQTFTTSSFSGATVSQLSGTAVLESGTSASGSATVSLRRRLEYRPGQGSMMRATALFDTPSAGNAQFVGAGSAECGYFIGYFAGSFGILHSETGQREIRKLTVTTGAGTGNVTVTLDGESIVVPVTGGNDVHQTAYQLALADYSQIGKGGWLADAISGSVYYIAARSNSTSTGSYSVAGASIAGTFTREKGGEDQTNTFITSGSFNIDKLDGSGPSGMVLDPQKGNVYQIGYQYLGYGNAFFAVEDPETGKPIPIHMIKNANARTTPVLKDPNLSVLATSANIGGTTSKTLKTVSMAAFTEGAVTKLDPKFAKSFTFSSVNSATYVPIAILKANRVYAGESSFGEFDILRLNGSNETNNKTLTVGLFLDAEIDGLVDFQEVDSTESIVSYASLNPATDDIVDLANSSPFHEFIIGGATGAEQNLADLKFIFGPGRSFTLAIKTSGAITGQVGLSWFEQQ